VISHATHPAHNWTPSGPGFRMAAAGQHGWDILGVPRIWGLRVLENLGPDTGAVIEDTLGGPRLFWFIACGRADTWPVPQGQSVVVLGAGCRIAVPGLLSTGQIVWRVPPTPGRLLTDAPQLHAALLAVLRPRPEAQR